MTTTTKRAPPTFIDPDRLYSLRGFQEASGISSTRLREGRLQGVQPNWIMVGRRKYLRGVDAIDLIERLSELEPKS